MAPKLNFVYKYNIILCASVSCLQQLHQTPIFTVRNILLWELGCITFKKWYFILVVLYLNTDV